MHGDDFTIRWHAKNLDWLQEAIKQRFDVQVRGRIGPAEGDDKSMRILNRIVEWAEEGIRYEADQRHAEVIIKRLGVSGKSKKLSAPAVKAEAVEEEDKRYLSREAATQYRARVARAFTCHMTVQALRTQ